MNAVEKVYRDAIILHPQDIQKLIEMLNSYVEPKKPNAKAKEDAFFLSLQNDGFIWALPKRTRRKRHQRIKVIGKPLSETIIEERR